MPADRTFLMGKFAALLPGDLRYAPRNHMWCREVEGGLRFGFSAYAVRLMQDVYFLDWIVDAGTAVNFLQPIGHIETSKAVADLFAPASGIIVRFNPELLKDPSAINVDKYGAGWLFEMTASVAELLDVDQYYQYLDENWEKTQRFIKGKITAED
ncbi:MAG: glycine cleavage system protein H [Gemmataceae bacterium]|nr:glycine cleavage system protein H [Gemmataceae bacterium]MDW8266279.1 glycine cleavage system protein H [Gemmataceae bacterium]